MSKRLVFVCLGLSAAVLTGMPSASPKAISSDLGSQVKPPVCVQIRRTGRGEEPDYIKAEAEAWEQIVRRFPRAVAKPAAELCPIDAIHYNIAVQIFVDEERFQGTTELIFNSKVDDLKKVSLWLDEATVDYVRDGTVDLTYSYTDSTGELGIDFGNLPRLLDAGETDTLTIGYQAGVPEYSGRVGAMISPRITYFAWNLWYPFTGYFVERDRATMDIEITVPLGQTALSNGRLAEVVENPDSTVTFKWVLDFPVPGPANLTAAPYVKTSAPYGDISVDVYTFPGDEGYAQQMADEVRDILDFYSSLFCRYPFSKLAIAEIDAAYGGGYGAQSLLCMYESFFRTGLTEKNVKFLAHEAGHQWWGHMVGFEDLYAGGNWLNEGFAEYSSILYVEHKYGREAMLEKLQENANRYLTTAFMDTTETGDKPITSPDIFKSTSWSAITYCKGSYIHHMLRYVVGDEAYFDIMGAYAHELYGDLATVDEFQEICERVSGQDLGWFFDQWLRDTGAPCYSVQDFYTPRQRGYSAKLRVFQGRTLEPSPGWRFTHKKVFDMPVEVTFHTKGGDVTHRVRVDSSPCEYVFSLGSKPSSVELDKGGWLLKAEVDYEFPISSLQAQATAESVALSWRQETRGGIGGYNIYRRETAGEAYQRLNPRPVVGTSYLDTTLCPDTFYYWVIAASDSVEPGYESPYSNRASNYPWIAYDDGTAESFNRVTNGYGAVRFTPQFYPLRVEKVRIYIYETRQAVFDPETHRMNFIPFELCLWDDDGEDGAPGTLLIDPIEVAPQDSREWYVVDLSGYELTITEGEFYIGWRDLGHGIQIGDDNSDPTVELRSWFSEGIGWTGYSGYVSMIRAQVAPVPVTAVGEAVAQVLPESFRLAQNHPNPFNAGTIISFELPADSKATLKVYDLLGQEVRTLVDRRLDAGSYRVRWDGRDEAGRPVASGVYFYHLVVHNGGYIRTKRMLLLR